jgi:hypothetical protein
LVIQALEQLNNWNEIKTAKQAVIQTYMQQISDTTKRAGIAEHLGKLSKDSIERCLNRDDVQNILLSKKV